MEPANPGRPSKRMKLLERLSLPSDRAPDMGRNPDALERLRNRSAAVYDVGPLCLRIVVGESSIEVGLPAGHDATGCARCRRWRAKPNPLRDRITERLDDDLRGRLQSPQDEATGPC